MDTRTGRIYDVGELYPSREEQRERDRRLAAEQERFERLAGELDEERRSFEEGVRAGHVVPVSEQVARQQRAGQRVEDRRKRKAAKAARKANRK